MYTYIQYVCRTVNTLRLLECLCYSTLKVLPVLPLKTLSSYLQSYIHTVYMCTCTYRKLKTRKRKISSLPSIITFKVGVLKIHGVQIQATQVIGKQTHHRYLRTYSFKPSSYWALYTVHFIPVHVIHVTGVL